MTSESQLTPMMAQYRRIKGELPPQTLLLFRLGDFYEMFFEDAQTGAQLLNVALTKRGVIPMCGIPYHAAPGYISRLLKAGQKVAICDQMEDARPGQLVKREVTQILTPGTHFDDRMLRAETNNFLGAVCKLNGVYGLAFVDLTTGEFKTTELPSPEALDSELQRIRPAELIYPSEDLGLRDLLRPATQVLNGHEDWVFAPETSQFTLRDHFKVASLDGFGLKKRFAAMGAAGAITHYLTQQLRRDTRHLTRLVYYDTADYLVLDAVTLRNLEVIEPLHPDAPRDSSLFGAINRTITPMGARLLRQWLSQPLSTAGQIEQRQEVVSFWIEHAESLQTFREQLREVRDLERAISRMTAASGNARDLIAIKLALQQLPALKQTLLQALQRSPSSAQLQEQQIFEQGPPAKPQLIASILATWNDYPELIDLIGRAIVDEPPLAVKEGGLIRPGFDPALDELSRAAREGKDWIAKLQQDEIASTGIASLKVRFNSVFGYFIEITKANLDKVPAHYIRKQTIANGERFITPALKEVESKILGAEERSVKLEYDIFLRVREAVLGRSADIQQSAHGLAILDALAAFAEVARLHDYCRPEIGQDGCIQITDGRHPVLDIALREERFVPNDVDLSGTTQQIALITGPNMAGKSTYIRQVALLTLLAHTGSFIPARKARLDLVDRIFTRIGASDDLARGQSTFMVEMSETANILNNATPKSLVILDEIGRGTSTFDGLSLAWSIVEYLHNVVGAKTLFATHYHELTELGARLPRVRNFNVAVREWNDQIIFLRKILPGGADKSYGIQVARLAGIPKEVIERAKDILNNLEEAELAPEGKTRPRTRREADRQTLQKLKPSPQLDLFRT